MPVAAPTAAPPNFYDNLPTGGETAAGNTSPKKLAGTDTDEELMKGLTGVYRVLSKMAKLKPDNAIFKAGIDDIKEKIKVLVVQGLKQDPSSLDSGDDKTPAADSGAGAGTPPNPGTGGPPPSATDSTHAA